MSACDLEILAKNLKTNHINFLQFNTKEELLEYLKKDLDRNWQIGWGGSMTLIECGILDYLRTEKFPYLLDRDLYFRGDPERAKTDRKMFSSDLFLTSTNALTEDGWLVNIDGLGNRVALMTYGPKKVYFIVGKNKLVKNYEDAIHRIRTVAAPLNAKRLGLSTPCVKTLTCQDCQSKDRICNYTSVIKKSGFPHLSPDRMTVMLVNKNLGL